MCSSAARLGAMVTPFVAQVVLKMSVEWTIAVYATVGLFAVFLTLLLPYETRGRGLKESHMNLTNAY